MFFLKVFFKNSFSCFLHLDVLCVIKRRKNENTDSYLYNLYGVDLIGLWSDVGPSKTGRQRLPRNLHRSTLIAYF